MKTQVHKLGGDFFTAVAIKIFFQAFFRKYKGEQVLFVVSAIRGMTRLLRLIVWNKTEQNISEEFKDLSIFLSLNEFKKVHKNIIQELFLGDFQKAAMLNFEIILSDLENSIDQYNERDNKDAFYASILKFGELASSQILNDYLSSINIKNILFNAQDYITTNDSFKDAVIIEVDSNFEKLFLNSRILITQGFIGKNALKQDTVLGFDGSDYSATKFANALAENYQVSLTLWKKVRGVFSEDPNKNPEAQFLPEITRKDYLQKVKKNKTYVIRPDSISELDVRIEVIVRSFEKEFLNDSGTLIHP